MILHRKFSIPSTMRINTMKELIEIYESMGISPAVYQYGEAAIARL